MTNDETSDAAARNNDADAPGWGLPTPEPELTPLPPAVSDEDVALTPMQQAVVNEVAEGQRALRREMRWDRRAKLDLLGGSPGGIVGFEINSALGSEAARRVSESERAAQSLAGSSTSATDAEPRFPAGGPPTPEEVHEAEMHPWPHHGMAETIEHNRQLHQSGGSTSEEDQPPNSPSHMG